MFLYLRLPPPLFFFFFFFEPGSHVWIARSMKANKQKRTALKQDPPRCLLGLEVLNSSCINYWLFVRPAPYWVKVSMLSSNLLFYLCLFFRQNEAQTSLQKYANAMYILLLFLQKYIQIQKIADYTETGTYIWAQEMTFLLMICKWKV